MYVYPKVEVKKSHFKHQNITFEEVEWWEKSRWVKMHC